MKINRRVWREINKNMFDLELRDILQSSRYLDEHNLELNYRWILRSFEGRNTTAAECKECGSVFESHRKQQTINDISAHLSEEHGLYVCSTGKNNDSVRNSDGIFQ